MGIISTDTKDFDNFIKKRQAQLRRTRASDIFQPVLRDKQIPGMEVNEVNVSTYRYYYLSTEPGLTKLCPSIPNAKNVDHKTPRVSFYTSINQAIIALGGNQRGKEYYVYTPKSYDHHNAVLPHTNQSPTSDITGEVWYIKDVNVACLGKIMITEPTGRDWMYTNLDGSHEELYEWQFKILQNNIEPMAESVVFGNSAEAVEINLEQAHYTVTNCYPVYVVLHHSGTFMANIVKMATGKQYSHVCIAFNAELRPHFTMGSKKFNSNVLNPEDVGLVIMNPTDKFFKVYKTTYSVYVMYVNKKQYEAMQNCLRYFINNKDKIRYDFINCVSAWLGISSEKSERYFCSKFVAKVIDAGFKLGKVASLWLPTDFQALQNVSLVNKGEDFYRYNSDVTKLNLEYIKKKDYDAVKFKMREFPEELKIATLPHYEAATVQNNPQLVFPLPKAHIENKPSLESVLNSKHLDEIYLTSDWHLFKNHYKKEPNPVNTREIVKWCQDHLKPTDVFMYLGDIAFRYANQEDQEKSMEIMASIPGVKVLILGNHDLMLGQAYFNACGFDYVMEEYKWKDFFFTHKPVQIISDGEWNIHGHIHTNVKYNTCDGKHNLNVYPSLFNNRPVTLKELLERKEQLIADHHYNPNYGFGEQVFMIGGLPFQEGWLKDKLNDPVAKASEYVEQPPVVLFSKDISGPNIANMVQQFMKLDPTKNVAIKLHFGEPGNPNLLDPKDVQPLAQIYNATLVDCNTAYEGSKRLHTDEHRLTAKANGYTFAPIDILDSNDESILGCPANDKIQRVKSDIQQGGSKQYEQPFSVGDHLSSIMVGGHLVNYDQMIVYTHFKGHMIAGFGGAIKNIGMGLASGKHGKMQIHGLDWSCTGHLFLERLVESASSIVDYFEPGNMVYVNVLANLSTCCDCESDAPMPKMDDIGVLVSNDIVAIEQASFDLIREAPNNKELIEQIADHGGTHQIEYAEWLRMGSREYVLLTADPENTDSIQIESGVIDIETPGLDVLKESYIEFDESNAINESAATDVRSMIIAELDQQGKDWMGCNKQGVVPPQPLWEPLYEQIATDDMGRQIGYVKIDALLNNHNLANIQIGILKAYRGQGIAKKLCIDAIEAVRAENPDVMIFWHCNADNESSWRLAEACGLKKLSWQSENDQLTYALPKMDGTLPTSDDIKDFCSSFCELERQRLVEAFKLNPSDSVFNLKSWIASKSNLIYAVGYTIDDLIDIKELYPEAEYAEFDELLYHEAAHNLDDHPFYHEFYKRYPQYKNLRLDEIGNSIDEADFEIPLIRNFIEFAETYAKENPDATIILTGIWPLVFEERPDMFKDWLVIIKDPEFMATTFSTTPGWMLKAITKYRPRVLKRMSNIQTILNHYILYFNDSRLTSVQESWLFDEDTLYYNMKDFDAGKTNLALVVGFSGSGKTTLGKNFEAKYKDCEFVELDAVMQQWCFNDEQLKEMSTLAYEFFHTPAGEKYRVTQDYLIANRIPFSAYEIPLFNNFYSFAEEYAKAHPKQRFVLEGVWPLMYEIDPSRFKDWTVIIVGTSYIKSTWRSGFRDRKEPTLVGLIDTLCWKVFHRIQRFGTHLNKWIGVYRDYFSKPNVFKEHKQKV